MENKKNSTALDKGLRVGGIVAIAFLVMLVAVFIAGFIQDQGTRQDVIEMAFYAPFFVLPLGGVAFVLGTLIGYLYYRNKK